jgi:hypothetical protein
LTKSDISMKFDELFEYLYEYRLNHFTLILLFKYFNRKNLKYKVDIYIYIIINLILNIKLIE